MFPQIHRYTSAGGGGGTGFIGEMVGIDQPQNRKWWKVSDAVRVDWPLYLIRKTADSGDYWRETTIWAVYVSERAAPGSGVNVCALLTFYVFSAGDNTSRFWTRTDTYL